MTRKQYEGKMRQFQHNIHKQAKITGQPIPHFVDRINRPNFGYINADGKPVNSYKDVWTFLASIIKDTPLADGIVL